MQIIQAIAAGNPESQSADLMGKHIAAFKVQGIASWRKEHALAGDTTAVCRDGAFENDVAKSNLVAILRQHGIGQVRSR